jgi:two-component system sensor histidine kinase PilS (NtrC family)
MNAEILRGMRMEEEEKYQHWRSFLLFNFYRLAQATLLSAMPFMPWIKLDIAGIEKYYVCYIGGGYVVLVALGLVCSLFFRKRFHAQMTAQIIVDILCINALMFVLGGLRSGMGGLLLVSVAGASLVAQGRLALLYASMATLSILGLGFVDVLVGESDSVRVSQAGLLSLGFFATAISAHLLGRRVLSNAVLARQRGLERDNQQKISDQIMARMQDGVLVVDAAGRILNSNPQARSILGRFDLEGATLGDIAEELASSYLDWRTGDQRGVMELASPTGGAFIARFVDSHASNKAVLVFLEDLGKLRKEAQQLKLASLGRLTASIAHEIRNPLAAISHASELLMEEINTPLQDRLMRIVRDNTHRLDRIIQDVLVLGRQRVTRQEGVEGQEPIALRHYLSEFVQALQSQEALEEGVIQVNSPSDAELCFVPEQLRQVLWNLVMNALRYSSRRLGAVRLEVRLPGDDVELHVIDDGPGIPGELREQIFDPFFTTSARGTGLGLHIARELCETNGVRLALGAEGLGGHFILKGRKESCQSPQPPAKNDVEETSPTVSSSSTTKRTSANSSS